MSASQNNSKPFLEKWKQRVNKLKSDTYTLYLAISDPRTPWYAKAFTGLVVAYAFSPIDLVPDFIPVLGYLDDLILVPLGILLASKMIPEEVLSDCQTRAQTDLESGKPASRAVAVVIILIWITLAVLLARWIVEVLP